MALWPDESNRGSSTQRRVVRGGLLSRNRITGTIETAEDDKAHPL